jgi:hypothetical protein
LGGNDHDRDNIVAFAELARSRGAKNAGRPAFPSLDRPESGTSLAAHIDWH